jgi:hypothetical protein
MLSPTPRSSSLNRSFARIHCQNRWHSMGKSRYVQTRKEVRCSLLTCCARLGDDGSPGYCGHSSGCFLRSESILEPEKEAHSRKKTFLSRVPPSSTHAQQSLQHSKPFPSKNLDVAFGVTFRGEAVGTLRHDIAEGNGEVRRETIMYRFVHNNSRHYIWYKVLDKLRYMHKH